MQKPRDGSWIQTYTGIQFWPLDPRPEEIDIRDVAHSLSLLCRFNGHCHRFYSVAEHCLHVSALVAPEHGLWGLLHDAAEAYVSDIPRPIKQHLDHIKRIEGQLLRTIAERFALPSEIPEDVNEADSIMLATEKHALMAQEPTPWHSLPAHLDPSRVSLLRTRGGGKGVPGAIRRPSEVERGRTPSVIRARRALGYNR